MDSDNIEVLGNRLAAINRNARTEDDYMKIGTLFDFRILVRTERICEGDMQALQNKFMVEGLDGIKYTYNNGYIAKDPKLAVMNFINALERIPAMIEKREKENAELSKDIPVLQEIVAASWPKDAEIKRLNEELATLNRKIQLTLKPVGRHENVEDKEYYGRAAAYRSARGRWHQDGLRHGLCGRYGPRARADRDHDPAGDR